MIKILSTVLICLFLFSGCSTSSNPEIASPVELPMGTPEADLTDDGNSRSNHAVSFDNEYVAKYASDKSLEEIINIGGL